MRESPLGNFEKTAGILNLWINDLFCEKCAIRWK
jgi:hypothetical protein